MFKDEIVKITVSKTFSVTQVTEKFCDRCFHGHSILFCLKVTDCVRCCFSNYYPFSCHKTLSVPVTQLFFTKSTIAFVWPKKVTYKKKYFVTIELSSSCFFIRSIHPCHPVCLIYTPNLTRDRFLI